DIILEDGFLAGVKEKGEYFKRELQKLVDKYEDIIETRGLGLMLALEFSNKISAKDIAMELFNKCFLVNAVQEHTLRFLPPLIVEKEDIDKLINAIEKIL